MSTQDPLPITDRIVIPASELTYEYARSSGPGGQHVNTTDTAVRLRWCIVASNALPFAVKERVLRARANDLTQDGELLFTSERTRSRLQNIDDARQKLADLVRAHLAAPKKRVKTKPTWSSQVKRREGKAARGKVKQGRGRVRED